MLKAVNPAETEIRDGLEDPFVESMKIIVHLNKDNLISEMR